MKEFDHSQIDDYLMDRLSTPERKIFEEKMQSDAEFKTQVLAQQEAMIALEVLNDQKWKRKLQGIHEEVTQPAKVISSRRVVLRWLSAAAAFALLFVAGYWLLSDVRASPDQLFAEHYQSYDLNFGSRSGDSPNQLVEAGAYYRQKNFTKALPLFETLPDSLNTATTQLAKGICQIELSQYEQALPYFQQLIDRNDPVFKEQAQWYAAMAYLKLGQQQKACQLLKALSKTTTAFQSEKTKEIINLLC